MSKLLSIKCNQNPVGHHGNRCAPFFIQNMSQIHAMSKGSDRILDWKNWKAEKILMQAVSRQKELISKNNNSGWWYHLNVVTWLLSDQSLVTKPTNLTQRVASLFAYLGIWVQLENFPEVMIDDSTQEVSWEKDIILGTKNWNQLANANRPFPSWLVIECWQLFTCGLRPAADAQGAEN